MKLCDCGCGNHVKKKGSNYCPGHNMKGKKLTAKHKANIGKSNSKAKIEKTCLICGSIFRVANYRGGAAKYCSRHCRSIAVYPKAVENGFAAKKGNIPWNKGVSIGYIPEKAFKKGFTPWNKGMKKPRSINCRISAAISCSVRKMAKGRKAAKKWQQIVGWGLDDFKPHMEKQFKIGMSWENHGRVWHIDHVIPITKFNITSINCIDFKRCWSLENLQPLYASENISKGNRLNKPFQPCIGLELY